MDESQTKQTEPEVKRCPQCGKPIDKPNIRTIRVNRKDRRMEFCSSDCGAYYQMGCEG